MKLKKFTACAAVTMMLSAYFITPASAVEINKVNHAAVYKTNFQSIWNMVQKKLEEKDAKNTSTSDSTPAPKPAPAPAPTPTPKQAPAPQPQPAPAPTPTATTKNDINAFEMRVVELVNIERQKAGLAPLTVEPLLCKGAKAKSQDMVDEGYFGHTSPKYGSPFDMMKTFGVKYSAAGENIASGQKTPEAVMNSWMNSPGHRANILSPKYTKIGVGYAHTPNGGYHHYWTQWFTN